jgi:predicted ATPase/DNA-binding winged helix-turn-helix (wHTH) protein
VPLIGRDADLQALDDLVGSSRVVTVVGPGGVGKTRLVTEWVRRHGARFDGGAHVVSLAGEADAEGVVDRLTSRLGFGSFDALLLGTSAAPTVVVLDNCESAPGAARTVADALAATDGTAHVVATSREALRAAGEHVHVLGPLGLPAPSGPDAEDLAPAVDLFVRLARAAGAGWSLDDGTRRDVDRLVRALDGLPLAIELAAARMRAMTPGDLLELLDRRLDLLAQPSGVGDDRHSSLRAAIDASYQQLPDDHQRLFRRMGVFPAPVDLELVRRVAAAPGADVVDVLDVVGQLVDRSLVVADQPASGGTQYRLYDSIRAFALEQLDAAGEAADLRERYVDELAAVADAVVADAVEHWSPELMNSIVERFLPFIRAVEWSLQDPTPARAYRLLVPLYGPTHGSHAPAVAALARKVLDRWDGRGTPLRAEALAVGATAMLLSGDLDGAFARGHEALADPAASALARVFAHRALGYVYTHREDRPTGLVHLEAARVHAAGYDSFRRELEVSWAATVDGPGRDTEALDLVDRVADEAAAEDEVVNQAWACVVAANRRLRLGDLEGASRDADAILELAERAALPYVVTAGHRARASVLAAQGAWPESLDHWRAAVDHTVRVGDTEGLTVTIRLAAAAAHACGRHELADELWATAPVDGGITVLVSPFADAEAALRASSPPRRARIGPDEVARRALALLSPPPAPGGAADADASGAIASEAITKDAAEAAPEAPGPVPARPRGRVVRFEDCELDIGRHELRRAGEVVKVEPQVFDVLVALADRGGLLVSKNELLDEVWGDRFVSESALTSRIRAARAAVGDDGRAQRVIRTVHGRGYLFAAPLTEA